MIPKEPESRPVGLTQDDLGCPAAVVVKAEAIDDVPAMPE